MGGTADGCHRYSAAALVDRGRQLAFVEAFRAPLETSRLPAGDSARRRVR